MAKFSRIEVIQTIYEQGVMPLFCHPDIETGKRVLDACYKGGGRLLEFTNRGDFAHEVFGELVKYAAKETPDLIMGAGSIRDAGTATMYIQSGTNFIVTHALNPDVGRVCNRRKILWSPGCGSATEIATAEELGAEIIKLFPANALGPGFIKAVLGPSPWTSIMPTGGVEPTEENMRAWFDAGAVCLGMGSKLISSDILRNEDYAALQERIATTLRIATEIRGDA